jgi:hypothetical protein
MGTLTTGMIVLHSSPKVEARTHNMVCINLFLVIIIDETCVLSRTFGQVESTSMYGSRNRNTCSLNAVAGTTMMNVDQKRESSRIHLNSAVSCTRQGSVLGTLGMSFLSFAACLKFGVLEQMVMLQGQTIPSRTVYYWSHKWSFQCRR